MNFVRLGGQAGILLRWWNRLIQRVIVGPLWGSDDNPLFFLNISYDSTAEIKEYCWPQSFNISCPGRSVIMMEKARYGRMRKGRCLTSDIHVGCSLEVLVEVDRRCSGRQNCYIAIPDTVLHRLQPCPKDLLAYLEASYKCILGGFVFKLPCTENTCQT